jgi:hypothetical protein
VCSLCDVTERGATRALVLGLLALPFAVFAPFAIFSGARSLRRAPTLRAAAGLALGVLSLAILLSAVLYWWLATG